MLNDRDYIVEDFLEHHGILGMKWGIRRYQNKDGSLTTAGAKRYGANIDSGHDKTQAKIQKQAAKRAEKVVKAKAKTAKAVAKEKQKQKLLKEQEKTKAAKDKIKEAKEQTKALKKAQKENAELEKKMKALEKNRKEILKNPKKVYENYDLLTKEEISKALDRFTMQGKILDAQKKQMDAGTAYMQNILKWTGNALGIYNNVAKAYNVYAEATDKDKFLPLVSSTTPKKNNK